MKHLVLVADGMADRPIPALQGRTPLEAARKPNMDLLASHGEVGLVQTTPPGFLPGSDVANLVILGYDPRKYYSGRGPLEAAGMEVSLNEGDVAFRCNLVTFRDKAKGYEFDRLSPTLVMEDHTAGAIETDDARELIDLLNNLLGSDQIQFYTGKSYRHLMVWAHGVLKVECTPPHTLLDKEIVPALPRGGDKGVLKKLIDTSIQILSQHPINEERVAQGKRPANGVWFWGAGKETELPPFSEKYRKRGAIISAVDLVQGLGRKAGLAVIAAGMSDTDYDGKVSAAVQALEGNDLVYLHVEAPDEAGHAGDVEMKIRAIEQFDEKIVGPLLSRMKEGKPWQILLLSDHPTIVSTRDHAADPVPFLLCRGLDQPAEARVFSEAEAAKREKLWPEGHRLMDHFLG
ncbi:MAG TPA: cofactor-independent phosphoglycerate mutase [Candidatus Manganitrophaceae bacterium]|nr:cofactor-independent phosphoglycerate mutase [Candidatus Manganitrophaceae bacterium]